MGHTYITSYSVKTTTSGLTALCEEQNVSVSWIYPVINNLITKHLALNEVSIDYC